MVTRIIYWIILGLLWVCIGVNLWGIYRNYKTHKILRETLSEMRKNALLAAEMKLEYERKLDELNGRDLTSAEK